MLIFFSGVFVCWYIFFRCSDIDIFFPVFGCWYFFFCSVFRDWIVWKPKIKSIVTPVKKLFMNQPHMSRRQIRHSITTKNVSDVRFAISQSRINTNEGKSRTQKRRFEAFFSTCQNRQNRQNRQKKTALLYFTCQPRWSCHLWSLRCPIQFNWKALCHQQTKISPGRTNFFFFLGHQFPFFFLNVSIPSIQFFKISYKIISSHIFRKNISQNNIFSQRVV